MKIYHLLEGKNTNLIGRSVFVEVEMKKKNSEIERKGLDLVENVLGHRNKKKYY